MPLTPQPKTDDVHRPCPFPSSLFFSNSKRTTILKYNEAYYMLQVRVFPAFRLLSVSPRVCACVTQQSTLTRRWNKRSSHKFKLFGRDWLIVPKCSLLARFYFHTHPFRHLFAKPKPDKLGLQHRKRERLCSSPTKDKFTLLYLYMADLFAATMFKLSLV